MSQDSYTSSVSSGLFSGLGKIGATAAALVVISAALLNAPPAQAYDIDTHFYATYAMARYAGLKHEVAAACASAAEWPDETDFLGSPLIPDLLVGSKMRRLFHFPCTIGGPRIEETKVPYMNMSLVANCETEQGHPMAFQLFFEGLDPQTGSLIKACTALHTIEDSFAHAGNNHVCGHALVGHHPDRPSEEDGAGVKYDRMVHRVMEVMVGVRSLLPAWAVDQKVTDPTAEKPTPNAQLSARQLANNYINNPVFRHYVKSSTLKSPEYVKPVLLDLLKTAQKLPKARQTDPDRFWIYPDLDVTQIVESNDELMAKIQAGEILVQEALAYVVRDLIRLEAHEGRAVFNSATLMDSLFDYHVGETAFEMGQNLERLKKQIQTVSKNLSIYGLADHATLQKFLGEDLPTSDDTYRDLYGLRDEYRRLNELKSVQDEIERLQGIYDRIVKGPQPFISFGLPHGVKIQSITGYIADRLGSKPRANPQDLLKEIGRLERRAYNVRTALVLAKIPEQVVGSKRSRLDMAVILVNTITRGVVPQALSEEHRAEFEDDTAFPRKLEMDLRVSRIRKMIQEMFGVNVKFIENDKAWTFPAARTAQQILPKKETPDEVQVTFDYAQIDRWVDIAFRYYYPWATPVMLQQNGVSTVSEFFKLKGLRNDSKLGLAVTLLSEHAKNFETFTRDFWNSHRKADYQAEYFRNPGSFARLQMRGTVLWNFDARFGEIAALFQKQQTLGPKTGDETGILYSITK